MLQAHYAQLFIVMFRMLSGLALVKGQPSFFIKKSNVSSCFLCIFSVTVVQWKHDDFGWEAFSGGKPL